MGKGTLRRRPLGAIVITAAAALALVASSLAGAADEQTAPAQNGTIIVEKETIPDHYQPQGGPFVFTGAIDTSLGDGESAEADVEPGTHTVTEVFRAFWDVKIDCDDADSSGNPETRTATYKVGPGETVRCVFTNTKRSLIVVKKVTNPAGAEQSFAFDASYDQDGFSLADGQQNVSDPLEPGSYSVTEHSTPGWQLQSATCSNGDEPGDIDLPASVSITCTFTNVPAPQKLTPSISTDLHNADHQVITSAAIGSSVHDKALVTGSGPAPTGSVSFTVWLGNTTCSDQGSSAGDNVALVSGIADPSDSRTVPAGGLSFRGTYSGDANYNSAVGACEPLTAGKLTPSISTDLHNADHQVITSAAIGSSVHDKALVTGSGPAPTGSVSFTVWLGNTTCSDQGSSAGDNVALVSGIADPSDSRTVPAGGLSFRGTYSGDANYNSAVGACEPLTAGKLTPSISTDLHNADHQVITSAAIGSSVHDKALVTGSGPAPTGSVSFTVWLGNTTCSDQGSSAGDNVALVSGIADPSDSRTVPAGGLSFRGTYSGDANYNSAVGACEPLTARSTPPVGQGSISVEKSANPTSIKEPGGPVTYSVTITNTSTVNVTIENVVDDKFGDLDDTDGSGCFDVPINLPPGGHVSCTFQKTITGTGGTSHINTVTASGHDQFGNPVSDSDDARVDITPRLIDLVMVKEASSPTPLHGTVNYSLTVTNKGPDTATNVQVADPAPAGITYLTANPSQGTCNVSPSLITCSLGTIAAGQTVTIAITARATTVGSHTNTATVTGSGGRETNPGDNVDNAVTVVPAPLKPPTPQPKPKPTPAPEYCLALTVSPKMIKSDGKTDTVTVKVTAGSKAVKGITVKVSGAGVTKSAKTNGKGMAVLRINAKKPGLITVTAVERNHEVCGSRRIGVVGVFLPPVTG